MESLMSKIQIVRSSWSKKTMVFSRCITRKSSPGHHNIPWWMGLKPSLKMVDDTTWLQLVHQRALLNIFFLGNRRLQPRHIWESKPSELIGSEMGLVLPNSLLGVEWLIYGRMIVMLRQLMVMVHVNIDQLDTLTGNCIRSMKQFANQ